MARRFDPYGGFRTEPNMRQEMTNTLQGHYPEIAKKQRHVLRKMRTDSDGNLIQCDCVDALTKEPDKDTFCPVCFGEGYVWDEQLVDGYKQVIKGALGLASKEQIIAPGLTNLSYVSFFFEYDIDLTELPKNKFPDKMVELITDDAGNPVRPYKRSAIYRIGTAIDFRSDNGKLEYWRLDCYEEQVKFLNGPRG